MSQTYSQVKHELKRLQNDPDYSKFHDDLIKKEDEVDKLIKGVKDTVTGSPEEEKIKQELRKIVDLAEEYIKNIRKQVNQIEFVNRLSELRYITV
ncbi:MAG: hypothetical protein GY730_10700, partial [bacterium]|nr:hypothetical protein [bacterium]